MIRKQPVKTYQKKKTGQSSYGYSQSNLWEPRSFSKRISTNGKKNKPLTPQDDKDIQDLSLSYLDSTFDRMARSARLPLPPPQESHCSLNISSDVSLHEPSPTKTDKNEFSWSKETAKSKLRKRAKRKPAPPRAVYVETDVVVTKKPKSDSVNMSTKKDKAIRNTRRKVSAKTGKNLIDGKEKQETHVQDSAKNDFEDWFAAPVKSNKMVENRKKEKNRYPLRTKKNVMKISSTSSSDSESGSNYNADVGKGKTKTKTKNIGRRKVRNFDSIDTSLKELNDSTQFEILEKNREEIDCSESRKKNTSFADSYHSANDSRISNVTFRTRSKAANRNTSGLDYVRNFRRYSESKLEENSDLDPLRSNKYNRILTREQYRSKLQPKFTPANNAQQPVDPLDSLNNLETSKNKVVQQKDLAIKPCSVMVLQCNENKNPILSGRESETMACNMHSSEDLFKSSISNVAPNIESETNDAIEMEVHGSVGTLKSQSIKNQSDFVSSSDADIRPSGVNFARETVAKEQLCEPLGSLNYLKCSTPICAHVNNNKTINFLSPIIASDGTFQENRKFLDEKEAHESSEVNYCSADSTRGSKKCSDVPKADVRRRSARKKLSISYEEDISFEISDEYCKENDGEKIPYSPRRSDLKKIVSPTSQIQESLEILKLDLENSVDICNRDNIGTRSLLQKETLPTDSNTSDKILESTNKHLDTNQFTSHFKDSYSQVTPVSIMTTRSRRQLKLNMTMQNKFVDDSNQFCLKTTQINSILDYSQINPGSDNEIVDNFDTSDNRRLRNRVTKHRGSRFSVLKPHYKHNTSDHSNSSDLTNIFTDSAENDSAKVQSAINTPRVQASINSTFDQSTNLDASKNLDTISLHSGSTSSTQDYGLESRSNYSNTQNKYTTSSNQEIVQSVLESTVNMDSVNIRSPSDPEHQVNVKVETPTDPLGNDDDSNSEWSTLSSSGNFDLTTSNLSAQIKEESFEENQLTNLPLTPSKSLMIPHKNELDNDLSHKSLNNVFNSDPYLSPKYTDIALIDRMKLLSTRVNTRKLRKEFLKPVTTNIPQVYEEEAATETADHSKLTNSFEFCSGNGFDLREDDEIENVAPSLDGKKDSELFIPPVYINLNKDMQPQVLLERLEDPLKITTEQSQDWEKRLISIHETSSENLRTISKNSDDSFSGVDEDDEDFEKSDPLYCPPELPEADNSSFKSNIIPASHSDFGFLEVDVKIPEIIDRQSVLASPQQSLLKRSKKDSSSTDANHSVRWRSRKSNSSCKANTTTRSKSRSTISLLDVCEKELARRQSVFLKPGKDWTRSLSILNNIQNGSDLEELSNGKGKKWRKSVQTILAMQKISREYSKSLKNIQNGSELEPPSGAKAKKPKNWRKSVERIIALHEDRVVESCFGKSHNGKDTEPRFRSVNQTSIPGTTPCSEEQSIGSASPGRFIRRMSIRVVPDNKRLSLIQDTSFLEAYGITPSKSGKTLSRSSAFEVGEKTLTCSPQCEDEANETVEIEQIVTPRDVVLQRCGQDDYLPFDECFPRQFVQNCRKIGEGVYGEVFLYETRRKKSVIKIIPIEGEALVNGERQKRFDEILSEIVIAKELHNLRYGDKYQTDGFVEVKNIRCIKGKYPDKLIELWKAFDHEKGSENDCPAMFDKNQLYVVLELGHGGEDLEAFVFYTGVGSLALFIQAAFALAVAEQSLEFEHRDLHWGNILISETKDTEVSYKLNNEEYTYPTQGLKVAIIDFTLSRMSYDGCCIFNDLALDPSLFIAQGEYQFDIYRLMRDKVGDNWQKFEPYTNVLWLHYTIDKMMSSARYKHKFAREHREAMYTFHGLKEIILNYKSAFDFVTNCETITSFRCKNTTETITDEPIIIESHD